MSSEADHLMDGAVAFAFDIDGVLVNGKKPVPGARETLLKLQRNKIPFICLTNSGGVTEKANLDKLALRLGDISFDETQIVQSHTPFRALLPEYADKTILALGGHGDSIRQLAKDYGFKHVVTSSDITMDWEHVHPFPEMTKDHHQVHGRKWDRDHPLKIAAILIWSSPRDWCLDLQITLDLLLSAGGVMGTRSAKNGDCSLPNNGYLQDGQPKLFFCNPDFEWSTQHQHPRLAQGGFREALRGLWQHATKGEAELDFTLCGKPTETTYLYAERVLQDYYAANPGRLPKNIRAVYMIGDNPESDIAGANAYESRYGSQWRSILVETGVYVAGSLPAYAPHFKAKTVNDAVELALEEEGLELD
ncbi:HAD-superfamily hydrolase [Thozetella sp. PMI_491]|nr:HAD-superfamily hydrolase [Thozetella sp. PMI_491]